MWRRRAAHRGVVVLDQLVFIFASSSLWSRALAWAGVAVHALSMARGIFTIPL